MSHNDTVKKTLLFRYSVWNHHPDKYHPVGSSHHLILLLLTSIEWIHQSVRAIMGSTSAVHYEMVCMYKVVMRFVDVDNPSEHLSNLCSLLLTISQHGGGSQPLLWYLPVVLTLRGNFFFSAPLPPPPSPPCLHPDGSPALERELCFAKVQLVLLTSKAPVGDGSDQIPL